MVCSRDEPWRTNGGQYARSQDDAVHEPDDKNRQDATLLCFHLFIHLQLPLRGEANN